MRDINNADDLALPTNIRTHSQQQAEESISIYVSANKTPSFDAVIFYSGVAKHESRLMCFCPAPPPKNYSHGISLI